jgi:hypothetical protein
MRWLNRDPIGVNGGLNEYGFLENNGVNKVDPLGLKETNWRQIGIIVHGHVPHCIEWKDVGGGTRINHQITYCNRCNEMVPSVPKYLCAKFANDAVKALGLKVGRFSTAFTAIYYDRYREEKDKTCKSSCKRQYVDYAQRIEIRSVGQCVCKGCGGTTDTTTDEDITPANRISTTSYSVDKGCL